MSIPTLVIMAAGIGNRYGGLKQVEPLGLNGELLIDYSIFDALKTGFGRIIFIIREEFKRTFRERIGKKIEKQVDTSYVFQKLDINLPDQVKYPSNRIKPWGTAHAILICKKLLHCPFAVINADDFYGKSSFKILYDYLKDPNYNNSRNEFCMVAYKLENTLSDYGYVTRGICKVTKDSFLKEIKERKVQKFNDSIKYMNNNGNWIDLPKKNIVSMNIWGFTPSIFNELEKRFITFLKTNADTADSEYLIPEVIGSLIKEEKVQVKVLRTAEKWFGLTYKEDKSIVQKNIRKLIEKEIYPLDLWGDKVRRTIE